MSGGTKHSHGPECAGRWIQDMKAAQGTYGRGAGGRELALAITNAEQAVMWSQRAVDLRRQEQEAKDAAEQLRQAPGGGTSGVKAEWPRCRERLPPSGC